MDKESLSLLYQKLKSLDFRSSTDLSLNLLKEFSENVINLSENSMRMSENREVSEEFIEENYFGMNILWKLILDESPLSPNLTEEAGTIFRDLISKPNCKVLRKYYLMKSIKEIENVSSIPQSLLVINQIIQMNSARKNENEGQMKTFLVYYEKNFGLINLIIKDLARYSNKIKANFPEKLNKSQFFDETFEGKHSHRLNLKSRLEFLETFANYSLLTEESLENLWEIFVLNPLNYIETSLYFHWLAHQSEAAKGEINIILTKPLLFFHFKEILCNPAKNDFKNLKEDGFNHFYLFFVIVNMQDRMLRMDKSGKLSNVITQNVTGIQVLWQIFTENQNEKVIEKVIEVLSELHLRVAAIDGDFNSKRRESAENFTTFVMNMLKEAYVSSKKPMINKSIYLLIVFFEKFEGNFFKSSAKISNSIYHFMNATVILRPENIQKEIRINVYDQVGNFRRKISEEFQVPLNQVKLIHKNEVTIDDSDADENDEMTMREFGLGSVYVVWRKKEANEDNYHPKHLISESRAYLDLLFRLLSEADAGIFYLFYK